ncbi:hypothetical protein HHI36_007793 [Cryptolaemus montrouzieri]|uniref:PiggyBac transposable element-derived protein domain-containing protein n=1 Tax=Cryptolaemus montrouzieri TaxID=559131 RepID=A0ABD2MQK7_9CUCU
MILFHSDDESASDVDDRLELENENFEKRNPFYKVQKSFCRKQTYENCEFLEDFGLSINIDRDKPMSIFEHFFDYEILDLIVIESHRYAAQLSEGLNQSASELETFLGILIIMGFHQLPTIRI